MSEIIYKEIVNGVEIAVRETQQCIILEFNGELNQTQLRRSILMTYKRLTLKKWFKFLGILICPFL